MSAVSMAASLLAQISQYKNELGRLLLNFEESLQSTTARCENILEIELESVHSP